jgi:hypothetical protein
MANGRYLLKIYISVDDSDVSLVESIEVALSSMQDAISRQTTTPWPAPDNDGELPESRAYVDGDDLVAGFQTSTQELAFARIHMTDFGLSYRDLAGGHSDAHR